MRLLRTDDYKLVEANDLPTPFPEYAILSHTWISPKDEITYQDFKQRKADIENDIFKQKGWAKLREYCDRAAKDGWDWAWMDTCCIDKTNSADTEKAINAMFRWYQSAGICYAYLDDVDAEIVVNRPGFLVSGDLDDTAGRDNVADPTSFSHRALKAFLIQAKWFTRGWTLQELLAPPYLVFVDQAWRRIGTRESWADEIKEASRIEARHLTNFSPTNFTSCSIAMRLSWASCRETTVEEDETYSLLGLFGISLPLIYGEGRWRAFNRLQRELITVYNDDSIFAWIFGQTVNRHSPESPQQGGTFLEYEERRERPDSRYANASCSPGPWTRHPRALDPRVPGCIRRRGIRHRRQWIRHDEQRYRVQCQTLATQGRTVGAPHRPELRSRRRQRLSKRGPIRPPSQASSRRSRHV